MTVRRSPDTSATLSVQHSHGVVLTILEERWRVNPAYDVYGLTEEHQLLRASVRDLADDVIAPRAAEIDDKAEFPSDVYAALKAADMVAIHVPEEYGGAG